MKTGQTLQDVATILERQRESKRDFIAPTQQLVIEPTNNDKDVRIKVNGQGYFTLGEIAHEQIAARTGIPNKYYERLRLNAPNLLAANVNHWFTVTPEKRMVRTLDGNVRAFLSDRYRPLDNPDLAEVVLPIIQDLGCKIESIAVTDKRFYIKAVTPRVMAEIKQGDVVQAGISISNSEVGLGSVKVDPLVFRLSCLNGLISQDYSMNKYHVGRGHEGGDMAEEFFSDATRMADDKAFWMKVRDVVKGAFNTDVFNKIVNSMRDITERAIEADVVQVVDVVQKKFGFSQDEKSGVLKHLIQGGDLTQYGLLNAVTRMSQDVESYDRATEVEKMGGQILELPKREWELIANAKLN